jgi:hypothetical protein
MPCFQCKYLSSLFFFAVITSCSENVITPAPTVVPTAPSSEIADGAQDGHPRFYFLPPIGQESEFEGEVDATLRPEVTVCKLAVDKSRCNSAVALVADFKDVSLNGNHYQEEWRTAGAGLDTRPLYRVRVLVLGTELGHVDVRLVDNDHDSENEDKVIPLRVGRTLPIKFRIERGAVTVLDPSGGTVTSADGRVTLKVPPGALAGSTAITIVPASVPSDFLAGYDFQPEGLTFATRRPGAHSSRHGEHPNFVRREFRRHELEHDSRLEVRSGDASGERADRALQHPRHRNLGFDRLGVRSNRLARWSLCSASQLLPTEFGNANNIPRYRVREPWLDSQIRIPARSKCHTVVVRHFGRGTVL